MDRAKRNSAIQDLGRQLQARSAGLNATRTLSEVAPSSHLPVLGPFLALLRRLVNRLATRWYAASLTEQQPRFNAEVTATFDELAAAVVSQAQQIEMLKRREVSTIILPTASGKVTELPNQDIEALAQLSKEALLAWENADLPAGLDTRRETALQEMRPVDLSIRHPLHWAEQVPGWRYLFNMAVVGPALNCRPADLVLDFGGGSGWVAEFLNRFGLHIVLLDYAEVVLRHSRARFAADSRLGQETQLHPVCGDGMRLPFAGNAFDGIICMNALHHMPSYEVVLREMCRVLKPGCRVVFGEPGETHTRMPITQWTMREQRVYEKNVRLPLIYVYAMRNGFSHMWRYPYAYPEQIEFAYPDVGRQVDTVLEHMRDFLQESMAPVSLFALQKAGERVLDSNAPMWQLERYGIHGEVTLLAYTDKGQPGSTLVDRVRVKNTGQVTWRTAFSPFGGFVRLGLKLCDADGREIHDRLDRPSLPHDMAPGEEVDLEVPIRVPTTPGMYVIKYDLVNEWRSWFELLGDQPATRTLVVMA